MADDKREKDAELLQGLIKIAQQHMDEEEARRRDPDYEEILFTPERDYGKPYPEGSQMDGMALRALFLKTPASKLVQ